MSTRITIIALLTGLVEGISENFNIPEGKSRGTLSSWDSGIITEAK